MMEDMLLSKCKDIHQTKDSPFSMTWTKEMDDEYAKAFEWYETNYYDDIIEYKAELKKECERKLAQIREDIENGVIV